MDRQDKRDIIKAIDDNTRAINNLTKALIKIFGKTYTIIDPPKEKTE